MSIYSIDAVKYSFNFLSNY